MLDPVIQYMLSVLYILSTTALHSTVEINQNGYSKHGHIKF